MDILIPKDKNSCIRKDLNISLGDYTILAGENNSGKSTIIRAVMGHDDLKDYEKIYIPAEDVRPKDSVLKNTASADGFYKIIQNILKPLFKESILDDLVKKFSEDPKKVDFINGVNKILKGFGVDKKEFDIKIPQDKFKESIIIKIAEGIVRDLYKTDIEEVDIENIGMGIQRLIVAALIQYYQEQGIGSENKVLIVFEEPEIYLHPKLKKTLYKSLLSLSERPNTLVLITTHDPYFIEMGKDQKVWSVFRNKEDKDVTAIEEIKKESFLLGYNSDSEINYFVFGLVSKSYFLELYQHIRDKNDKLSSEDFEKIVFSKIIDKTEYPHDTQSWPLSYISRLRHNIAHPKKLEDRKVPVDLIEKLNDAIVDLLKIN